jgi:hypothetical protein
MWSFTICQASLDGRPGSGSCDDIRRRPVPLKYVLLALFASQCALACGSSRPDTGVGPTIVNGSDITLPAGTLGYRRAGLLSAPTAISLGVTGTLGEFECSLLIAADAENIHRCSLSTTLRRDVEYWIYLRDPDRAQGIDYHDEFVVGTQTIRRVTQVCFPTGSCYRAGAFRIVDGYGTIQ